MPPTGAHLTVVQHCYHQGPGAQPVRQTSGYSQPLSTTEQPYVRTTEVKSIWVPLDLGWLRDKPISEIVLECIGSDPFQVQPTDTERLAAEHNILVVGVQDFSMYFEPTEVSEVKPGQSIRFRPTTKPQHQYFVGSRTGSTKYNVTVYPG